MIPWSMWMDLLHHLHRDNVAFPIETLRFTCSRSLHPLHLSLPKSIINSPSCSKISIIVWINYSLSCSRIYAPRESTLMLSTISRMLIRLLLDHISDMIHFLLGQMYLTIDCNMDFIHCVWNLYMDCYGWLCIAFVVLLFLYMLVLRMRICMTF